MVPLVLLDDEAAGLRLASAVAHRIESAGARTVNREPSALRSAISWWQRRDWIAADPTALLRQVLLSPAALRRLDDVQLAVLFEAPAGLREQALWRLLLETGAAAEGVLGLDAGALDLAGCKVRTGCPAQRALKWGTQTSELLSWLLAGRRSGPVFLTGRRAPAGTDRADVCPLTGKGRLSYRRAAQIFTEHTRPLDPDGHGWMLHQLRQR